MDISTKKCDTRLIFPFSNNRDQNQRMENPGGKCTKDNQQKKFTSPAKVKRTLPSTSKIVNTKKADCFLRVYTSMQTATVIIKENHTIRTYIC